MTTSRHSAQELTVDPAQELTVDRRRADRWHTFSLVLTVLLVWEGVAWGAARLLIKQRELPRAEVLFVLSGSANYAERVELAAQLFSNQRGDLIVLTNDDIRSGWSVKEQRNPLFVERAKEYLRRVGVPEDKIQVLSEPATGTHDEALRAREYARTHNVRSLLVVTSAYHSRRALWTFNSVFQNTDVEVGLIAVPLGKQSPSAATWWLLVRGWRMVAAEYLKLGYYWLVYRQN